MTEHCLASEQIEWAGYTFVIKSDKELAYMNDDDESSPEEVIDRELDEFYSEGQYLDPDLASEYNTALAETLAEAVEEYQRPLRELGEYAAKYALIPGQLEILKA